MKRTIFIIDRDNVRYRFNDVIDYDISTPFITICMEGKIGGGKIGKAKALFDLADVKYFKINTEV